MEPAAEAHLAASLRRELEEELLGREELGHDNPEVWRMECVGFGINLLSGNYE